MPTLVVNDPSYGEGLSGLMGGFVTDPKRRAEALALQARIDAQSLAARQTQIENENLLRQRKIQDETATTLAGQLTPEAITRTMPQTVAAPPQEEQRKPFGESFQGPFPTTPVRNPQLDEVARRSPAAQQIARFVISRGGTPEQAAAAAYKSLELGRIYGAGALPTTEAGARTSQTFLTGQIPDATKPLSEQQRRVMETEERAQAEALEARRQAGAMERERLQQETNLIREREQEIGRMRRFQEGDLSIGQNATVYLSPERRRQLGLPEGPLQGQVSVGPKETVIRPTGETLRGAELPDPNAPKPADPAFAGTGFDAVAHNKALELMRKEEAAPGSLTPDELRTYSAAYKKAVEDPKWQAVEVDDPARPGVKVKTWQQVPGGTPPLGFLTPEQLWAKYGLPPPAPAPGANPSSAPVGGPAGGPSSVTPPVSATTPNTGSAVPPAQAAASTPTGGAGAIGTTNAYQGPTENQANVFTYTQQAKQAMGEIVKLYQANPRWQPQFLTGVLGAAAGAGGDQNQGPFGAMFDQATKQAVGGINTKLDPVGAQIQSHEQSMLIAILRDDTGAAISPKEFGFYRDLLVPQWNDSPETRGAKLQRVDAMIAAREAQKSLPEMLAVAGLPGPRFSQIVQDNPGRFVSGASAGQPVRTAPSSEPPAAPPPSPQSPPTNPSSPQIPEGAPAGIRSGEWFFNPRTRRRERAP